MCKSSPLVFHYKFSLATFVCFCCFVDQLTSSGFEVRHLPKTFIFCVVWVRGRMFIAGTSLSTILFCMWTHEVWSLPARKNPVKSPRKKAFEDKTWSEGAISLFPGLACLDLRWHYHKKIPKGKQKDPRPQEAKTWIESPNVFILTFRISVQSESPPDWW